MKSHLSRGRMLSERDQFMALLPDLKAPALRPAPPTSARKETEWMDEYLPKWEEEHEHWFLDLGISSRAYWYERDHEHEWDDKLERMAQQALRLYPEWDPYDYDPYPYHSEYDYPEAWPEYANTNGYMVYQEFDECLEWTAWWAKN